MTILLLNGYVGDDSFYFAGSSSKEYMFKWDKKLTAYTFRPTCQEDADDIFKQNGTLWNITARCDGAANDETPMNSAPTVKTALPARYYKDLDTDELVDMARSPDVGMMDAKVSDGKLMLLRLLGAYFQGAGLLRGSPEAAAAKIKAVATPPVVVPEPVSITSSDIPIATGLPAPVAHVASVSKTAPSDDIAPIKRRRAAKRELAHA